MPRIPGAKLGLYEILTPLGARSTGEVESHRPGLASDARHMAGSEREAQTLRYSLERHARARILTDRS